MLSTLRLILDTDYSDFSLPPQLREAALLSGGHRVRISSARWHTQSNSDQMLKPPLLLKKTNKKTHHQQLHPLCPPLCIVSTTLLTLSPIQASCFWGRKEATQRSEWVITFKLTPQTLEHLGFCTQEAAHQGFQNDIHTPVSWVCSQSRFFFVCVLIVVREWTCVRDWWITSVWK